MSLQSARNRKSRVPVTFRCPPEVLHYIIEAAKAPKRNKTEVITSAIELDRDLAKNLRAEEALLDEYATENGLRPGLDTAEVIASLVKIGIEAYRQKKAGR